MERGYIESLSVFFERVGVWSYDHRWWVLVGSLAILCGFGGLASSVRFDNSFENYFDASDPVYRAYLAYRDDFGSDETAYIVYEAPDHAHGPWNIEVMRTVQQLTEVLEEEVPFLSEVTSLTNVEFMEPVADGLEIFELMEDFPADQADLLVIRDKLLAKPMYVDSLASRDGKRGAIVLEMALSSVDPLEEIRLDPDGGDGMGNLYPQVSHRMIEEILARPEFEDLDFYYTGDVPLNAVINLIAANEGALLGGLTVLVIAVVLATYFRRPLGVLGPLAVVLLSLVVAIGAIGLFDWNLDLLFGILPTLVITVGVADAVHIVSEFDDFHASLGSRREAIRRTLYLVGAPCLLTSLTTAAGFMAMSVAPIASLSRFAVYASVGVLAAFLLSITLLVFLLTLGRERRSTPPADSLDQPKRPDLLDRGLVAVAQLVIRRRGTILLAFVAVFLVSIAGILRIEVDSNYLTDFGEHVRVRGDTMYVDEVMSGTNSYAYLFDSGEPDGIKNPEVLREMERLQSRAEEIGDVVTRTSSIVDLLKDINQTFNGGDPAYYSLPESRELVAQYLLVYELSGGDELDSYISSDYARAALSLRCGWVQSKALVGMSEELGDYLVLQPVENAEVSGTGIGRLWVQLTEYITWSQIRSLAAAFSVVTLLMCILFQSVKIGLLAMVPNISPVLLGLGVMGWLDIDLSYSTLLIAPVAIGIAVDDTMHLLTRYRHEFARSRSYAVALVAAMRGVGRALVVTSVVLVLGFMVGSYSDLDSQVHFAQLLAGTIFVALLADFLLLPALILTLRPFGPAQQGGG